jgi:hypothetical protein
MMYADVITDSQGVPIALIPPQYLWDLVEYLSTQRLSVHYSYRGERFAVSFPRMTLAAAQQTLDEWKNAYALIAA